MTHEKIIASRRRAMFWILTILLTVITGSLLIRNATLAKKEISTTAAVPETALASTQIYSNNFESAVGSEWRNVQTNQIPATSVTPVGARRFLGEFGNNEIQLLLNNLPAHNRVSVVFDLYVIRSWDGNGTQTGPDVFEFGYDGQTLKRTTFSQAVAPDPRTQAYPGDFPGGVYDGRTGASECATLGYEFDLGQDCIYQISQAFSHSNSSLQLNFKASGLEALSNESWGIDNVRVMVETIPNETVTTLMPYESAGYRYQILPTTQTPPVGFEQPNYNDSAWSVGQASFGFNDGCVFPFNVRTNWQINTRLILRKTVTVPANAENLRVNLSVDNDIEKVWFNGTEISRPIQNSNCTLRDQYYFDIPQNLVQTGNNLIAYQVSDRGRQTFFDSRITSNNQIACNPPSNGLVSWYRAEDTANDSFGNNNGNPVVDTNYTNGKIGQGFTLNGVSSRVEIPEAANLNPELNSFTVDAWVRTNISEGRQIILEKYECGGVCIPITSNSRYTLAINLGKLEGKIRSEDPNGGDGVTLIGMRNLADGNFHHVAVMRDITANEARIYVDGILEANTILNNSSNGRITNDPGDDADPVIIGATRAVASGTRVNFFNGTIDEVKYFNRALSATEINSIYQSGNNPICQSSSTSNSRQFDFDGDGKADLTIFRPNALAEWWFLNSSNGGNGAVQFGNSTDKPVPADYTGDGKTDFAFWRPASGEWFILRSGDFSFYSFPFGTSGDIPIAGDFDGDGKSDQAIFRPSTATWYILQSSGGTIIRQFGLNGDVPVQGDFDGDGKADIAIFRPSNSQWFYSRSSDGQAIGLQFGTTGDKVVPADYTGDGKTDVAVWRPSNGNWYIVRSEDSSFYAFPFGAMGDIPAPADYDGDGKADVAVFRSGTWYINQSSNGVLIRQFGIANDKPVQSSFIP